MANNLLPSLRETYRDHYSLVERADVQVRLLEEYRTLYTAALARLGREEGIVLGVSSPAWGEGKTTVATNIAGAMAADLERRVLLASCAFVTAEPQREESRGGRPGLAEYITDPDRDLEELVVQTPLPNLSVLFSGARPENPSRLVRSGRLRRAVEGMRAHFDITVVDLMPILSASDSQVLASYMDGVVLVVSMGESSLDAVLRSAQVVGHDRLLGIAANRMQPVLPRWLLRVLGGSEWGA